MRHGCGAEMRPVAVRIDDTTVNGWQCPNHPEDEYVQDWVWDRIEYAPGTAHVYVPFSHVTTSEVYQ